MRDQRMKILFLGSTRRGLLALKGMVDAGMTVVGILSLTQEAHEQDRSEGEIATLAATCGIPIRETKYFREETILSWATSELGADVAIAVGVRILLPDSVYGAFSLGCWAVHDSLLPYYRGFAPLNWVLINDEPETGVTLFRVSAAMDEGEILLQRRMTIGASENAPELYHRICAATVGVVLDGLRLLASGESRPVPQNPSEGSLAASRSPVDGMIDWARPTRQIFNLIRALTFPYPGAFTFYQGKRMFVLSAEERPMNIPWVGRIPGRVVQVRPGIGVDVLTGDGVIRLGDISIDGTTRQCAATIVRSVRSKLGLDVLDLVDRLARLEQSSK
jgi:methionyl-tRNA formyltransferase